MRLRPAIPSSLVLLALSCSGAFPPPNPFLPEEKKFYSDETGLVGVETPVGSLAGSWGLAIEVGTRITLPVLGTRNSGSIGTRIVTRTWDAGASKYSDSFTWCLYQIYEVEGSATNILPGTLSKAPPVLYESTADHAVGAYRTTLMVNNWGWRNMPDPTATPMPNKDNYSQSPQSDWMWDMDEDGKPGFTARLSGFFNDDVYTVSTSVYSLDGTVTAPDHVSGLIRMHRNQQNTLDSTNAALVRDSTTSIDEDPKSRWFDMVRLRDGATCADVDAAVADGRLSLTRPF